MGDLYRSILEHAASGILLLDRKGHILDYNAAANRMLGRGRGSVKQSVFPDLLAIKEERRTFFERVKQLEEIGHLEMEVSIPAKEGTRLLALEMCLVPWTALAWSRGWILGT